MDTCTPFEGNPDSYGLGIRIGVYLQWISAWINLLLDPESAQATYDANSIFVFTIIIATIIAAQRGSAAIEMYLMLQVALGFFVTTLSTLGVRLWFMSPDRLAKFGTTVVEPIRRTFRLSQRCEEQPMRTWGALALWAQTVDHIIGTAGSLSMKYLRQWWLRNYAVPMPLNIFSPLKPPGLSWSGVVWRSTTASIVAAYNLAFWFGGSGSGAKHLSRPGCGPPDIFLLSKQPLEGPVVVLCRVAAVIVAVFVFPVTLFLLTLTVQLWVCACLVLCRHLFYRVCQPQTVQSLQSALGWIYALWGKDGFYGSLIDVIGFFATPQNKAIRFSDVIKVCVSLGTGKVTAKDAENGQPGHGGGLMSGWKGARSSHRIFCSLWNVYTVLSIAWFITSIECTILWNDIRGVNTIDTTGQLLPFIIGCVSASQVIKKLMILAWKKKYPDWEGVKLEAYHAVDGTVMFRIVKRGAGDDPEEFTGGENIGHSSNLTGSHFP